MIDAQDYPMLLAQDKTRVSQAFEKQKNSHDKAELCKRNISIIIEPVPLPRAIPKNQEPTAFQAILLKARQMREQQKYDLAMQDYMKRHSVATMDHKIALVRHKTDAIDYSLALIASTGLELEYMLSRTQQKQQALEIAGDSNAIKEAPTKFYRETEKLFVRLRDSLDNVESRLKTLDLEKEFSEDFAALKSEKTLAEFIQEIKDEKEKLSQKFTQLKIKQSQLNELMEQIKKFDNNKAGEKKECLHHLESLNDLQEKLFAIERGSSLPIEIKAIKHAFEALKLLENHPSAVLKHRYSAVAQHLERLNAMIKPITEIKAAPQNPEKVKQVVHVQSIFTAKPEDQNKLNATKLEALGIKYFGATKDPFAKEIIPLKGVFPDYLKQRAEKFWFKDFCRDLLAFVFGSYYIADSKDRSNYIAELRQAFNMYQRKPAAIGRLEQLIDNGLSYFSSRAKHGDKEYPDSLAAKLNLLKTDLVPLKKLGTALVAEQKKASIQ